MLINFFRKPDIWEWQHFVESRNNDQSIATMTKVLSPSNNSTLIEYIADFSRSSCDGFWRNYYLG